MAEKNYITPEGYKRLVDELTELATVERPRVVREVSDAAAEGDRSENAAYIYGKRRLREIDRRMGFLQRRLENIQVVKVEEQRKDRVFFGAFVTIEDEAGRRARLSDRRGRRGRGRSAAGSAGSRRSAARSSARRSTTRCASSGTPAQRELTVVDIAYEAPTNAKK